MKVHYVSCATSSAVDGKTNKLSLFHILDEISGPTFPLQLGSFCVASLFERDVGEDPVQIYALTVSLNGTLLASFTLRLDFQAARRNRSVNTIQGLTIPAPGTLLVRIVQRTSVLAQWQMPVIQVGVTINARKDAPSVRESEKRPAITKAGPTLN